MKQTSSAPELLTTAPEAERRAGPQCGCNLDDSSGDIHAAAGVDPSARHPNLKRLRLIEGQVRGLQRMIQDDRYCADILIQVSSVHEALRAVGRELMRNHLRHYASISTQSGIGEQNADEIIELIYRSAR